MSSRWGILKALKSAAIATILPATAAFTVNAYQAHCLTTGRSIFKEAKLEHAHASDAAGVALGLSIHHLIVETPDFKGHENRKILDEKLSELYAKGHMDDRTYHTIRGVNISLFHQQKPLEDEPMNAIIAAIEKKHEFNERYKDKENMPGAFDHVIMIWKVEKEIAEAFEKNGSPVGYCAHLMNGAMESSICLARRCLTLKGIPFYAPEELIYLGGTDNSQDEPAISPPHVQMR